jgi:hypothetical protein
VGWAHHIISNLCKAQQYLRSNIVFSVNWKWARITHNKLSQSTSVEHPYGKFLWSDASRTVRRIRRHGLFDQHRHNDVIRSFSKKKKRRSTVSRGVVVLERVAARERDSTNSYDREMCRWPAKGGWVGWLVGLSTKQLVTDSFISLSLAYFPSRMASRKMSSGIPFYTPVTGVLY